MLSTTAAADTATYTVAADTAAYTVAADTAAYTVAAYAASGFHSSRPPCRGASAPAFR